MRQLAGTLIVFSLISCAAASEVLDDERDGMPTTMAEVTVEGSPEETGDAIDLDAAGSALEKTKITLAAPYLEVRAVDVKNEGHGATFVEVRTIDGWHRLPDELLAYDDEDPGCPSIERESSIDEIRVEQGALVIVSTSDHETYDGDRSGPLMTKKARACRDSVDGWVCGEPTVVAANVKLQSFEDEAAPAIERSYTTKYWVNADGEIETERPFDDAALTGTEPGT